MLRNRIITAVILAPLALVAILYLPPVWFAVVFWILAALACYEWAGMLGLHGFASRLGYVAIFGVLALLLFDQIHLFQPALVLGCGVWLLATVAVLMFPRGQILFRNVWFMGVLGIVVFIPAWVALVVIRGTEQGSLWLIWMLFLVWGADVGAYFAGRAFGKHKLAPSVSPGKTWEGAVGGFALAAIVCGSALPWIRGQWLWWLPIMAGLIVVSVIGDLFESVLKRSTGIKDSGTLLPGHGGVLDRIDSLLAVLPVFAILLI